VAVPVELFEIAKTNCGLYRSPSGRSMPLSLDWRGRCGAAVTPPPRARARTTRSRGAPNQSETGGESRRSRRLQPSPPSRFDDYRATCQGMPWRADHGERGVDHAKPRPRGLRSPPTVSAGRQLQGKVVAGEGPCAGEVPDEPVVRYFERPSAGRMTRRGTGLNDS
jgi:hypothetical protein